MPKPKEFKENEARLMEAQRQGNGIAASQLLFQRGELNQRAVATAVRYAAVHRADHITQGRPRATGCRRSSRQGGSGWRGGGRR